MPRSIVRPALALLAAVLIAGGCKRTTSEVAGEETDLLGDREPVASVLLGEFGDEAHATALRDSLALEGWSSHLVSEGGKWRVHVMPTVNAELAAYAAEMLKRRGRTGAAVSRASLGSDVRDPGVDLWAVNGGTSGMASRTRWALSPDGRAIIVMEDVAGTENGPLPNGVLVAGEVEGHVLQMDSVWDAAPSPDWRLLAVGRALLVDGGRGGPTSAQWRAAARSLPDDVIRDLAPGERNAQWEAWVEAQLRAHAFPASGMTMGSAVGIAQVIPIDSVLGMDPARRAALARPRAVRFEGWRVAWSPSGDTLAVGSAPRYPRDDLPPPRWTLYRPTATGTLGEATDSASFARVPWVQGPVLDVSITINLQKDTVLETRRARVESKQGFIRVTRRGARADEGKIIGPGKPLAVTANGRFVVALVPRPNAKEGERGSSLVVYRVIL